MTDQHDSGLAPTAAGSELLSVRAIDRLSQSTDDEQSNTPETLGLTLDAINRLSTGSSTRSPGIRPIQMVSLEQLRDRETDDEPAETAPEQPTVFGPRNKQAAVATSSSEQSAASFLSADQQAVSTTGRKQSGVALPNHVDGEEGRSRPADPVDSRSADPVDSATHTAGSTGTSTHATDPVSSSAAGQSSPGGVRSPGVGYRSASTARAGSSPAAVPTGSRSGLTLSSDPLFAARRVGAGTSAGAGASASAGAARSVSHGFEPTRRSPSSTGRSGVAPASTEPPVETTTAVQKPASSTADSRPLRRQETETGWTTPPAGQPPASDDAVDRPGFAAEPDATDVVEAANPETTRDSDTGGATDSTTEPSTVPESAGVATRGQQPGDGVTASGSTMGPNRDRGGQSNPTATSQRGSTLSELPQTESTEPAGAAFDQPAAVGGYAPRQSTPSTGQFGKSLRTPPLGSGGIGPGEYTGRAGITTVTDAGRGGVLSAPIGTIAVGHSASQLASQPLGDQTVPARGAVGSGVGSTDPRGRGTAVVHANQQTRRRANEPVSASEDDEVVSSPTARLAEPRRAAGPRPGQPSTGGVPSVDSPEQHSIPRQPSTAPDAQQPAPAGSQQPAPAGSQQPAPRADEPLETSTKATGKVDNTPGSEPDRHQVSTAVETPTNAVQFSADDPLGSGAERGLPPVAPLAEAVTRRHHASPIQRSPTTQHRNTPSTDNHPRRTLHATERATSSTVDGMPDRGLDASSRSAGTPSSSPSESGLWSPRRSQRLTTPTGTLAAATKRPVDHPSPSPQHPEQSQSLDSDTDRKGEGAAGPGGRAVPAQSAWPMQSSAAAPAIGTQWRRTSPAVTAHLNAAGSNTADRPTAAAGGQPQRAVSEATLNTRDDSSTAAVYQPANGSRQSTVTARPTPDGSAEPLPARETAGVSGRGSADTDARETTGADPQGPQPQSTHSPRVSTVSSRPVATETAVPTETVGAGGPYTPTEASGTGETAKAVSHPATAGQQPTTPPGHTAGAAAGGVDGRLATSSDAIATSHTVGTVAGGVDGASHEPSPPAAVTGVAPLTWHIQPTVGGPNQHIGRETAGHRPRPARKRRQPTTRSTDSPKQVTHATSGSRLPATDPIHAMTRTGRPTVPDSHAGHHHTPPRATSSLSADGSRVIQASGDARSAMSAQPTLSPTVGSVRARYATESFTVPTRSTGSTAVEAGQPSVSSAVGGTIHPAGSQSLGVLIQAGVSQSLGGHASTDQQPATSGRSVPVDPAETSGTVPTPQPTLAGLETRPSNGPDAAVDPRLDATVDPRLDAAVDPRALAGRRTREHMDQVRSRSRRWHDRQLSGAPDEPKPRGRPTPHATPLVQQTESGGQSRTAQPAAARTESPPAGPKARGVATKQLPPLGRTKGQSARPAQPTQPGTQESADSRPGGTAVPSGAPQQPSTPADGVYPGAAHEPKAGGQRQERPRSTRTGQQRRQAHLQEVERLLDRDALVDELFDRLYRRIEQKRQIEREKRGYR